MNVKQQPEAREWGIDWKQADEIGVRSVGWREAAGARWKRGVEINLCHGEREDGHRITVSRVRARQIAIALAEASGMHFDRGGPFRRLPLRLSLMLSKNTIDISDQNGGAA